MNKKHFFIYVKSILCNNKEADFITPSGMQIHKDKASTFSAEVFRNFAIADKCVEKEDLVQMAAEHGLLLKCSRKDVRQVI